MTQQYLFPMKNGRFATSTHQLMPSDAESRLSVNPRYFDDLDRLLKDEGMKRFVFDLLAQERQNGFKQALGTCPRGQSGIEA